MAKRRTKGEGSIYRNEKANLWIAQITLPDGKRKSKSSSDYRVVSDWLLNQRNKLQQGLYVSDDQVKLGDYIDRYMEDVAIHTLRPTTFQTYSSLIRNHIKPDLGHIRLTKLQPGQIQRFYSNKLNSGLSSATVQYLHAILHKTLDQALRWGLVIRNVSDLVDVPRAKKQPPNVWNSEQIKIFLETVKDHRWYPVYVIAVSCGLRKGEILGLYKEDFNLDKGILSVKQQVVYIIGQGATISTLKTDRAQRLVTLPDFAISILRPFVEECRGGLLFTTSTGKPVSPSNLVRHFKTSLAEAGLPKIRFHDLRHSHATILLAEGGVHPKVVQERLGHSQISLTLDTYSHVIPSLQVDASDKLDAIFK